MTQPEPRNGRVRKNGLTIRAHRGVCVLCRCGVYEGDEYTRGRGRLLGIVHDWCLKNATKEEGP